MASSLFLLWFLTSPCLFYAYQLCFLFLVASPAILLLPLPNENPLCDLHFSDSVPVLVVCLAFVFIVFLCFRLIGIQWIFFSSSILYWLCYYSFPNFSPVIPPPPYWKPSMWCPFLWFCSCSSLLSFCFYCFLFFFLGSVVDSCEFVVILLFIFLFFNFLGKSL